MCFEGSLPALIYPGDRVTWKVLAEYSWSPTITQSGSFLCTAASSTPIRVVTKKVRYIHELSLTLEHSMLISSPTASGLTSPRALRSRVLQASSICEGIFECFECSECSEHSIVCFWVFNRVRRVVFQILLVASRLWGAHVPKTLIIYGAQSTRAPYRVAPEP